MRVHVIRHGSPFTWFPPGLLVLIVNIRRNKTQQGPNTDQKVAEVVVKISTNT